MLYLLLYNKLRYTIVNWIKNIGDKTAKDQEQIGKRKRQIRGAKTVNRDGKYCWLLLKTISTGYQ